MHALCISSHANWVGFQCLLIGAVTNGSYHQEGEGEGEGGGSLLSFSQVARDCLCFSWCTGKPPMMKDIHFKLMFCVSLGKTPKMKDVLLLSTCFVFLLVNLQKMKDIHSKVMFCVSPGKPPRMKNQETTGTNCARII